MRYGDGQPSMDDSEEAVPWRCRNTTMKRAGDGGEPPPPVTSLGHPEIRAHSAISVGSALGCEAPSWLHVTKGQ